MSNSDFTNPAREASTADPLHRSVANDDRVSLSPRLLFRGGGAVRFSPHCPGSPNEQCIHADPEMVANPTKSLSALIAAHELEAPEPRAQWKRWSATIPQRALAQWLQIDQRRLQPLFDRADAQISPSVVLADNLAWPSVAHPGLSWLHESGLDRTGQVLLLTSFLDAGSIALPQLLNHYRPVLATPQRGALQDHVLADCSCAPTRRFATEQLFACMRAWNSRKNPTDPQGDE